jgi:hypothetical protein
MLTVNNGRISQGRMDWKTECIARLSIQAKRQGPSCVERTGPAYSSPKEPVGPDAVPCCNREANIGQPMRNRPRPNYDRQVIHQPEEMEHPDEKEDATRDDKVQLVAHRAIPAF